MPIVLTLILLSTFIAPRPVSCPIEAAECAAEAISAGSGFRLILTCVSAIS